jgi:serine/threonine-protein kinase RsbW
LSAVADRVLTSEAPNVRLYLTGRPENVLLVREMLMGLGEAIGLDGDDMHDIRTAVTEACNNVVLHAYEGADGPLEVEVLILADAIEVVVRDHGGGIRPLIRTRQQSGVGLGVPMIQALARSVEFLGSIGDGTEVRMQFNATGINAPASRREDGAADASPPTSALSADTKVTIAPTHLARSVLARLLSALGARAHFSTDRISDVQLLADALAAHGGEVDDDQLSVAVEVTPRNLHLRVGPLPAGRARRLVLDSAVAGLGPVLESLSDGHTVIPSGGDGSPDEQELLVLRLTDRRK